MTVTIRLRYEDRPPTHSALPMLALGCGSGLEVYQMVAYPLERIEMFRRIPQAGLRILQGVLI